MLFREVLPAVIKVLSQTAWLTGQEVTLVRALDGRVRLVIETPQGGQRPSERDRAALEQALQAVIGAWLGDAEPVWCPKGSHSGLLQTIRAARRPWAGSDPMPCVLYVLERHAARHGWVGELAHDPPWSIEDADAGLRPPIVTFFSHKGGVGRTTALVATAVHLAERGQRVLVLDLDLEAPGLATLLAEPAPTEPGLLDLMVAPDPLVAPLLRSAVVPHDSRISLSGPPILVLKAGEVDADYLALLARVDLHGLEDVAAATRRLKLILTELAALHRPDLILLDARTGFHDVGGVALGVLSHGAVFFGLSNEQSWHGLRAVARALASAGFDADDDPRVWLEVVQAMAPPTGEATPSFQERAYDLLTEAYFSPQKPPPPEDLQVLALPFRDALRGAGDRLTPAVLATLREAPWAALADRVAARYAALQPAGQQP